MTAFGIYPLTKSCSQLLIYSCPDKSPRTDIFFMSNILHHQPLQVFSNSQPENTNAECDSLVKAS